MRMIPAIIKCILRNQIAIGQAVTIIISLFLFPAAYSGVEINKRLNIDTPQTSSPLARQSSAEESRMIRQDQLNTYVMIKVTTNNQKRFDANHDGYLSGKEFDRYIKHYSR